MKAVFSGHAEALIVIVLGLNRSHNRHVLALDWRSILQLTIRPCPRQRLPTTCRSKLYVIDSQTMHCLGKGLRTYTWGGDGNDEGTFVLTIC